MNVLLRLQNLTKSFSEGETRRVVLDDIHWEFATGRFFAIVGKSGSGKSTLLNLISGIDLPERGAVWINGHNLTAWDERRRTLFRRTAIGFVFQFFHLIPTLTVGENVLLPLELNRVPRREARRRAEAMLAYVGLADRWSTFPEKLSGGEQQRVALARALVHDPPLILADEPTGNLDDETGAHILDLLARLAREGQRTLVMVTHSPEAASYADHVLRLSHGRLWQER
jgi:putative ABC transport system ATP-binding protein